MEAELISDGLKDLRRENIKNTEKRVLLYFFFSSGQDGKKFQLSPPPPREFGQVRSPGKLELKEALFTWALERRGESILNFICNELARFN